MSASNFISIENFTLASKYTKNPKYIFEEISLKSTTDTNQFLQKYGAIQGLGYCGYYAESKTNEHGEQILATRRPLVLGQCECGDYVVINFRDLKSGHTQSCGCKKFGNRKATEERGGTHVEIERLANLTRIIESGESPHKSVSIEEFERRKLVLEEKMKQRKEKTALYMKDYYKKGLEYKKQNNPEKIIETAFYRSQYSAQKRTNKFKEDRIGGIPFELDYDFFKKEVLKDCYYCGKPAIESKQFNGLDRIDSSKGYTEDNVVPCCGACNRAKGRMSKDEYIEHLLRIYKFIDKGNFQQIP